MNIKELYEHDLGAAAKFSDTLNPSLWDSHERLKNTVHNQILIAADDYCTHLGIMESQVIDVIISGPSAGYTHTPTDTVDVVVVADLNPDPTFREFFNENRYAYNRQHPVKVGEQYVKFYVQPSEKPVVGRGVYSLLSESWIQVPVRRNILTDDTVTLLREAEQRAQPIRRPVAKKRKIAEARKPVVYGYGEDVQGAGNFKNLNEFVTSFKFDVAPLNRIILENHEDVNQSYLEHIKQSVLKWIWESSEKIGGDISDFYGESDIYGKLVVHYASGVNLCEAEYRITDILPTLERLYGVEQQPVVDEPVDIVQMNIKEASGKVTITCYQSKTVTEVRKKMCRTKDGKIIPLGNTKLNGLEHTRTYFLPAGRAEGVWTLLSLEGEPDTSGVLFLNGWQINKSSDSPRKKYAELFKNLNEDVGMSPSGISPNTRMFLSEEPLTAEEVLEDFIAFCSEQLGLENVPQFKIKRDPEWSKRNRTFGRFNSATGVLEVSVANRHLMDVLRTVAHELVHQRQAEVSPMPADAGETGSDHENEANAQAGILMRDYGQMHPELFAGEEELDEGWRQKAAAAAASAALLGGAGAADAQSVQGALGVAGDVARATQTFKGVNWGAMLGGEAQNAITQYSQTDLPRQLAKMKKPQAPQQQQVSPDEDESWTSNSNFKRNNPAFQPESVQEGSSGYIPTKKQAKDPRYSMALTTDVQPGTLGRVANAFKLNTDSQGRPQIANPDGTVKRSDKK